MNCLRSSIPQVKSSLEIMELRLAKRLSIVNHVIYYYYSCRRIVCSSLPVIRTMCFIEFYSNPTKKILLCSQRKIFWINFFLPAFHFLCPSHSTHTPSSIPSLSIITLWPSMTRVDQMIHFLICLCSLHLSSREGESNVVDFIPV